MAKKKGKAETAVSVVMTTLQCNYLYRSQSIITRLDKQNVSLQSQRLSQSQVVR